MDHHPSLWVFDRPLLSDGLFWSGLTLGVVRAFYETTAFGFAAQSAPAQAVDLGRELVVGVVIVGVVGGFFRHVIRGCRRA